VLSAVDPWCVGRGFLARECVLFLQVPVFLGFCDDDSRVVDCPSTKGKFVVCVFLGRVPLALCGQECRSLFELLSAALSGDW
jgi:hypothetical protein